MAKHLKTWGWTGQREAAVCGSNPDGFTREIVCADSRDDAIALASPGFGAPVPDDLYVSRLAGEKLAAAAVPGIVFWKPQHLPGLPFQATMGPAEALARVSHPERADRFVWGPGDLTVGGKRFFDTPRNGAATVGGADRNHAKKRASLTPVSTHEIPSFASEEEEANFWSTHELGADLLNRMESPNEHVLPPPRLESDAS